MNIVDESARVDVAAAADAEGGKGELYKYAWGADTGKAVGDGLATAAERCWRDVQDSSYSRILP